MATKQQLLIDTLEQPFEMGKYIKFVTEFFNTIKTNTHIQTTEKVWGEYREHIKSYTKIGRYIDDNNKKIDIWAVELCSEGSVERARSLQRNFISKLLTADNSHAGIIAFYVQDAATWRLSFVKLEREFSPKGIQIETTPAKRYSYLVGKGEKSHTAQEQLLPVFQNEKQNPTLELIEEAFSIETVTKEFFAKYKEKYLQLKEYLDKNNDFVQTAEQYNFKTEQFAKKLMGQLAFLYFLQKKGWLGVSVAPKILTEKQYKDIFFRQKGDARRVFREHYEQQPDGSYKRSKLVDLEKDNYEADLFAGCFVGVEGVYKPWGSGDKNFIRRIFDNCMARTKETNFFDDYLEPLFYNALNNPRGKNCYFPAFNSKIPFLNGGLFEPLFDNWEEKHFDIPNEIFSNAHIKKKTEADGILDIFERFNFTINEDEPLEREVAVDPEMLGKIFENLLDVKDRKSKGAFYTPREIVHYMCQESIINHLVNETGVPYDDMKQFVLYGEIITNQDNSRKTREGEQERAIPKEVLERIEAIDKALVAVRVADPAVGSGAFPLGMLNEIVKLRNNVTQYMINVVPDEYPGQKDLIRINRHPYKLKWETIQNCIFAVDIEASAVDITKLRLWLSLIVDQEIDEVNEYPHALPNLDCNIMCGNSLIEEFEGIKLFDEKVLTQISGKVDMNKGASQLSFDTDKQEEEISSIFTILFDLQKQLFGEDDPERKKDIKKRIDDLIENAIEYQLRYINKDEQTFKQYKEGVRKGEKPYFLWKLEFAIVFIYKGGFDIVIGNPPYVDSETMVREIPGIRNICNNTYQSAKGNWDLFIVFIELALRLLNENGNTSFIIPNKIIAADYAKEIRKIMAEHQMVEIRDYSNIRVFAEADVYPITYLISNSNITNSVKMTMMHSLEKEAWSNSVSTKDLYKSCSWDIFFSEDIETSKVVEKLLENRRLEKIATVKGAASVSEAYLIKEIMEDIETKDKDFIKFINTGTIDPFRSLWGNNKTKYIKDNYIHPVVNKHRLKEVSNTRFLESQQEKIIVGGMNKILECYYDDGEYLAGKSTTIIMKSEIDLKYILGILNSELMHKFYKVYFNSLSLAGGYFRIGTPQLKQLPIAIGTEEEVEEVIKIVDSLIEENENLGIKQRLNEKIYKIYRLTDNDIELWKKI